ncbi:hypothetical protein ACE193_15320 [Bernardetia sp. OM2101]|uniref:hypothetical protein n=1 Tax=Bernardetia sp. OM2101 TaxID=3344876 RepID=UPI0035D01265
MNRKKTKLSTGYNPKTKKHTLYLGEAVVLGICRLLEDYIRNFEKQNHPQMANELNYFEYAEIYLYKSLLKKIRSSVANGKGTLVLFKIEAQALSKIDMRLEPYFSKIT